MLNLLQLNWPRWNLTSKATFEAAVKLYWQEQDLEARMAAMQARYREAREQFEAIQAQLKR